MKVTSAALFAALATAVPSTVDAWTFGPGPLSIMRPLVITPRSRLLRELDFPLPTETPGSLANRGFSHMSPRYEITDNDEKFQIAIDVPGMKAEDIHISVEDDDNMLAIEGKREKSGDNYSFSSKFSQRFSLDPAVELEKFTANLNDGVLVISAPKDIKKIEQAVRSIPITSVDESAGEKLEVEHKTADDETAVAENKDVSETGKETDDLIDLDKQEMEEKAAA